jgi:hypothetical protein
MKLRTINLFLPILFCALSALGSRAQAPTDGHLNASSYENTYFQFSYAWPKMLRPVDTSTLQLPRSSPNNNEFLLFSAQQGDSPFGVVIMAEKMGPTSHNPGFKNAADFLDRIVRSFKPEEHMKVLARTHVKNAEGRDFEELDYQDGSGWNAGVVTQIGQFLILFKCNAQSAADLSAMTKSILASHPIK